MSENFISPFQMKKNTVLAYNIQQNDLGHEYVDKDINYALGVDYLVSDISIENNAMEAYLDLFIGITGKFAENDEKIIDIKLNMRGVFSGDTREVTTEDFGKMVRLNGISTLMQLSRAFVTTTTALSGHPSPINCPMVNVYELIKAKEQKEG